MSVEPGRQPAPSSADARVGTVVDKRYRVEALLGSGGMGSVYRAEHMTLRRPVALKLLHAELGASSEMGKRFEREAYAAGRLVHPNCVQVSDFGQLDDGTLFLAMELLDGRSLGDLLEQSGRVPWPRALHICAHVLRGLAHAHAHDIVHRDIKPENVIVVEQDDDPCFAKVLDFGIAKLVGAAESQAGGKLTRAGVAFGTPQYMSPEQAWGQAIDGRADLYAVTILLFELIAGRPPFQADEPVKVLTMHATRPAPRICDVAPELAVPAEVEAIVARGLAKDVGDRFPDALAYVAAIEAALAQPEAPAVAPEQTPAPVPTTTEAVPSAPVGAVPPATPIPAAPSAPLTRSTGYLIEPPRDWKKIAKILGAVFGALILFAALAAGTGDGGGSDARLPAAIEQLESGSTCAARRQAVHRLRAIGDRRAIPALQRAVERRGLPGLEDPNACLRKTAQRTIRYLRRR